MARGYAGEDCHGWTPLGRSVMVVNLNKKEHGCHVGDRWEGIYGCDCWGERIPFPMTFSFSLERAVMVTVVKEGVAEREGSHGADR